jgi:enamine deaminase RidA (YjgF/YER057c/UK114 family)
MHSVRSCLLLAVLLSLLAGSGVAQKKKKPNPEEGYIPVVAPEDKKKKKADEDITQALALPPELPAAVSAETGRLAFRVTPLSAKGLLSQQTRNALRTLLHSHGATIVKLRAFVAGSGDLRRVGDIAGEMFQDKHQPLPSLSVVQVGALPLEGAQVVIEATEVERKVVNPFGIAFLAGQPAASVAESLEKLKSVLAAAGMQATDALSVTCFVSSLDQQRNTQQAMAARFPAAALDYLQMQRGPVAPAAQCESVARLRTAPARAFTFQEHSQAALVASPQVVITGTQLAFGSQDNDLKLAFDRLERELESKGAGFTHIVRSHLYITSGGLTSRVLAMQSARFGNGQASPPSTLLPLEALPSLDAAFGLDVIAVPDSANTGH